VKPTLAVDSLQAYLRLHDPLCAKALSIGQDPAHFPAAKAFFPFIREASVLQMPQTLEFLASWLCLAFHAGFLYGDNLPSQAEELLDHNGVELSEALRRVRVLRDLIEPHRPTPGNLWRAFQHICKKQWPAVPAEQFPEVLVPTSFSCFKAGLAAATVAKADPFLAEFVDAIAPPIEARRMPLSWRLMMLSPVFSHCKPPSQLVGHPLPRLAATYYPHAPREREVILYFFEQQLHEFNEMTEGKCLSARDNINGWIRSALKYGHQVKLNQPKRLGEILAEAGETNLRAAQNAIRLLIEQAGSMDLSQAILRWHSNAFQWGEPVTYGRCLERVTLCCDLAIWISWLSIRD
jgi:hypothetical protein